MTDHLGQSRQVEVGSDSSQSGDCQHLVRDQHHHRGTDGGLAERKEAQPERVGAQKRGRNVALQSWKRSLRKSKKVNHTSLWGSALKYLFLEMLSFIKSFDL